jgi:hypothetical protein
MCTYMHVCTFVGNVAIVCLYVHACPRPHIAADLLIRFPHYIGWCSLPISQLELLDLADQPDPILKRVCENGSVDQFEIGK